MFLLSNTFLKKSCAEFVLEGVESSMHYYDIKAIDKTGMNKSTTVVDRMLVANFTSQHLVCGDLTMWLVSEVQTCCLLLPEQGTLKRTSKSLIRTTANKECFGWAIFDNMVQCHLSCLSM